MNALAAHGMAGAPVPRDLPPLTVTELAPIVAACPGLGALRAITWQSPRPFAASGTVACTHAEIFVKRHHGAVRTAADLAEEHAFIRHLRVAGAKVSHILSHVGGGTALEHAGCTYELHAISPGRDIYRNAESWMPIHGEHHAEAAGRALGAIHRAAAGFIAPPRATGLLVADFRFFNTPDPLRSIGHHAGQHPLLAAALANRRWRDDFERCLLPWHEPLLPHLSVMVPLWTHNDFHASNLLWHPDGSVATVIDFGLANRTSAVFDVATAIERNAIAWLRLGDTTDIGRPELAAALLRGYREAQDFSPAQTQALRHLLPLVHVDFALSELAYFHGVTWSAPNAERAYRGFLLGHAAWFKTHHGLEFVDAIQ